MSLYILPWHRASKSVRQLREQGGFRVIRREESRFRGSENKKVFNYGCAQYPIDIRPSHVYNPAPLVERASNKRDFFRAVSGAHDPARIPEWTTDPQTALNWFSDRQDVIARRTLRGHSGEGIFFFSDYRRERGNLDALLTFPLFTKYKKKRHEFRVHCFKRGDGAIQIISEQKKVLRRTDDAGVEVVRTPESFRIRSHTNGFIFQRSDIDMPEDVRVQARKAFIISELDYGAVDVIWNEHEGQAYVLEINTAPGLEGQTVTDLLTAIRENWL